MSKYATECKVCSKAKSEARYDEASAHVIQALRAEAAAAGDMAQVAICDLALDGDADAQRECLRVIADAAGAAVQ